MKIKILLLLTFITCFNVFAQIGFQGKSIVSDYDQITNGKSVITSDLDGDGDLDIIVKGVRLGWYENLDGLGKLSRIKIVNDGPSPSDFVFSVDVDNDGDNDIISGGDFGVRLAWYENLDGLGSFSTSNTLEVEYNTLNRAAPGDIDGDGDIDIIFAANSNSGDTIIGWHENLDGQGSFSASQIISSFSLGTASTLNLADFDNDSDLDILITTFGDEDQVNWLKNLDGLGNFSAPNLISSPIINVFNNSVEIGDINNDGNIDIILTGSFGKLQWYNNSMGNGDFDAPMLISEDLNFIRTIKVSDIDGDNDLDLVIGEIIGSHYFSFGWLENLDGLGDFSAINVFYNEQSYAPDLSDFSICIEDIDQDGEKDILTAFSPSTNGTFQVDMFKNNGSEDFQNSGEPISGYESSTNTLSNADIDGDGDLDIITGSFDLGWYENLDGLGDFGKKNTTFSSGNESIKYLETADIDNDGDIDVVAVMNSPEGGLQWFENSDGLGNFSNPHVIDSNNISNFTLANLVDIDNDGDIDIVSMRRQGTAGEVVGWYENNGLGVFESEQIIVEGNNLSLSRLITEDIDNDGHKDLVTSSFYSDKIVWYKNTNGLGDFSTEIIISESIVDATSVTTVDMDNDGDFDVIASSKEDDKIVWFENLDGLGNFGTENIISLLADGPKNILSFDVDNDGDFDVVSISMFDNELAWYENNDGMGSFDEKVVISTNMNFFISNFRNKIIDFADINNNSFLDILVLVEVPEDTHNLDQVILFENLGQLGNEISGQVLLDINSNGCDDSDVEISNIMIVTDNGSSSFSTFTQVDGDYQMFTNPGNFTTEITSEIPNYFAITPNSHMSNFGGLGNVYTANFCLRDLGVINDLNISIYPSINDPRPGFDTSYQIVYNNAGTTQLSGNVSFEFDESKLSFLNASETIASQTSNTITFDFTDLNPFETRTIDLEFNVFAPPTTNIDDILNATATINPTSGDNTEEDNVFTLVQTVIGSYDPNDIRVLEGDQIELVEADKYLHYIIRFQNTGTASAINVRVENVLDNKLDWTTMQLENLSHTGRIEIKDGSEVSFIFDNINLPDSTSDEPNSHGFITYKIKPKSDVVVGDVFYNTADIFFDFNPAITTNTVFTEIVENNLSTEEFEVNSISIYPNPTENQITIKSKIGLDAVTIYDINGRILNYETLTNAPLEFEMDVSNISNGLYFLEIQSGNTTLKKKFIKK